MATAAHILATITHAAVTIDGTGDLVASHEFSWGWIIANPLLFKASVDGIFERRKEGHLLVIDPYPSDGFLTVRVYKARVYSPHY